MTRYHSLVIGAGPAGMSAAPSLARFDLSVALAEKTAPGGLRDADDFRETDAKMRASIPGVFAAGVIRSKPRRQVVAAAGDGVTAANSVYTYLMEQKHA